MKSLKCGNGKEILGRCEAIYSYEQIKGSRPGLFLTYVCQMRNVLQLQDWLQQLD